MMRKVFKLSILIVLFITFIICINSSKEVKVIEIKNMEKVYINQEESSEIMKLEIIDENPEVKVGEYLGLTKRVTPASEIDTQLKWTSSDENIATVNENGVVKGIKEGTVVITVKTLDEKISASKTVKVITKGQEKITDLKILDENPEVKVGEYIGLTKQVTPASQIDAILIWTSSDETIATVNQDGLVKGIKEGKVTITVKTQDGSLTATKVVTVIEKDTSKITKIELTDENPEVKVGEYIGLKRRITPASAVNTPLKWESSDETVATVEQNGLVKGIKEGTAIITAKTEDGSVSATKRIKVVNGENSSNKDSSENKNETSGTKMENKDEQKSNDTKVVNESSSNKTVIAEDDSRIVTINAGENDTKDTTEKSSNINDSNKSQSTKDSNTENKSTSTSTKALPKTGVRKNILGIFIVISIVFSIISYKKLRI